MGQLKFAVNCGKTIEAILWLVSKKPDIKKGQIIGLLYFADKEHLNKWGRPVLGSTYVKVAEESLDLTIFNQAICKVYDRKPDLDYFSETDIECLEYSFNKYHVLSTEEMIECICKERSFTSANVSEVLDFRLMIDADMKNRKEYIQAIQEMSYYKLLKESKWL